MFRSISFFFAVILVWLSLKPGLDALLESSAAVTTCCAVQCTDQNSEENPEENGCAGANCNPFQACGQCVLTIPEIPLVLTTMPEFFQVASAFAIIQFAFDWSSHHWQPPRTLAV